MTVRTLVVGIGSPHGDDAVGWEIARRVEAWADNAIEVRQARTPTVLLDWLAAVDQLEVCDAVLAGSLTAGAVHHWRWPDAEIERTPFCTSHDLSLPAVLRLAEALGQLPRQVRIWGVAINPGKPFESLSSSAIAAADVAARRICHALGSRFSAASGSPTSSSDRDPVRSQSRTV
jgi:hydrogenase maturation protease